jgi:thymidylate synthase (FAD)
MQVTYIDHMGSDSRVADAARVSFNKQVETFSDKDVKLIEYLATHNHWTPFSHVQITLREKVPIFVARQRFKHMVGFSYNEVSRRYVDDAPEFYIPDAWRKRAENKKQGSSDEVVAYLPGSIIGYPFAHETEKSHMVKIGYRKPGKYKVAKDYKIFLDVCEQFYNHLIIGGVAPEQARMVLPQSMYTEYYVTGSLAAWARAYKLRIDPHAQKEIQDLAVMWDNVIGNIKELEHSWKALLNN